MSKRLIKEIEPCCYLYIDDNNGITWIEDGRKDIRKYCLHDSSHNGYEMVEQGYWKRNSVIVKGNCNNDFNISQSILEYYLNHENRSNISDEIIGFYKILDESCQCENCKINRNR